MPDLDYFEYPEFNGVVHFLFFATRNTIKLFSYKHKFLSSYNTNTGWVLLKFRHKLSISSGWKIRKHISLTSQFFG